MNRLLILISILAACGDNAKVHPDGGTGDTSDSGTGSAAPLYKAVVLGADFSSGTGLVSRLDLASMSMQTNAVAGVATSDPVIRHFGDKVYVINRSVGENVTILDAHNLSPVDQVSTGASSNPQDVAVVGDKLYVPAYGTAGVVVLQNDAITKTIDLGTLLGDPDGKPDCVSAYAVGTKVFVACGLLDANFTPRGNGKVAVIDTTTDHATALTMPEKNPAGFFVQSPTGDLLISAVPSFDVFTNGCVMKVPADGTTAPTCMTDLTNKALGGFVNALGYAPDGKLWMAVVVDKNFATQSAQLRSYDGTTVSAAISGSTELIQDLTACPDGSVVGVEATFGASGLRVFRAGAEVTTAPLPIGLPPVFSGGVVCFDANHP